MSQHKRSLLVSSWNCFRSELGKTDEQEDNNRENTNKIRPQNSFTNKNRTFRQKCCWSSQTQNNIFVYRQSKSLYPPVLLLLVVKAVKIYLRPGRYLQSDKSLSRYGPAEGGCGNLQNHSSGLNNMRSSSTTLTRKQRGRFSKTNCLTLLRIDLHLLQSDAVLCEEDKGKLCPPHPSTPPPLPSWR